MEEKKESRRRINNNKLVDNFKFASEKYEIIFKDKRYTLILNNDEIVNITFSEDEFLKFIGITEYLVNKMLLENQDIHEEMKSAIHEILEEEYVVKDRLKKKTKVVEDLIDLDFNNIMCLVESFDNNTLKLLVNSSDGNAITLIELEKIDGYNYKIINISTIINEHLNNCNESVVRMELLKLEKLLFGKKVYMVNQIIKTSNLGIVYNESSKEEIEQKHHCLSSMSNYFGFHFDSLNSQKLNKKLK